MNKVHIDKAAEKKVKKFEKLKQEKDAKMITVAVKKMNVDAVAKILTDMQDETHVIKDDFVLLHKMISDLTQDLASLRAEIEKLKVMGHKGAIEGTGSTVHLKDE